MPMTSSFLAIDTNICRPEPSNRSGDGQARSQLLLRSLQKDCTSCALTPEHHVHGNWESLDRPREMASIELAR